MQDFVYNDLNGHFLPGYWERGEQYWNEGCVRHLNLSGDGSQITSYVKGDGKPEYRTQIVVKKEGSVVKVAGYCTCPIGYNCKHVAATLCGVAAKSENTMASGSLTSSSGLNRPQFVSWLEGLKGTENSGFLQRECFPADERSRLLYVLSIKEYDAVEKLRVELVTVRLHDDGSYGKPSLYRLERFSSFDHSPPYFLNLDKAILSCLLFRRVLTNAKADILDGEGSADVLKYIIETGRCHWHRKDAPPLRLAQPRQGTLEWITNEAGSQNPVLDVSPPATVLSVQPLYYLDSEKNECGPIESEISDNLIHHVLQAPEITYDQVDLVRKQLNELSPTLALPEKIQIQELRGEKPTPVLCLTQSTLEMDVPTWYGSGNLTIACAYLTFDYKGKNTDPNDKDETLRVISDNTVAYRIFRDKTLENEAAERLLSLELYSVSEVYSVKKIPRSGWAYIVDVDIDEDVAWVEFVSQHLPVLRNEGWRVEIETDFPFRIAEVDGWYADIDDSSDHNWFDMEIGITVEGEAVNLLPLMVNAINSAPGQFTADFLKALPVEHKLLVPLDDGRLLRLPTKRIQGILEVLVELFDPRALSESGRISLSDLRAADLVQLESAVGAQQLRWYGGERLRKLGERLQRFTGIESVLPPESFTATLRPYQQEGLNWLQFLRQYEFCGILADDMGLGKTVQTLAHLVTEKHSNRMDLPSLVIAPTSLMTNWRHEAERFAPELTVLTLHGPDRKQHFTSLKNYDLILTTYPLLLRDKEFLLDQNYHLLILDEAQYIKNPKAKVTIAAQQIKARHRICLTGTPMENHLGELWSVFNFLMPGLLGEEKQFRRLFRTPIENQGDTARREQLRRRIAPFLLRRSKDIVAKELPPKTEIVRIASLEGAQQDLYETIRVAMHEKVRSAIDKKGANRAHIEILDALLKLRQVCCDPRLVKIEAAKKVKQSAKLDMLMDMLPKLIDEGRRVLLFSQFTTMLGLIEEALHGEKIAYVKLTGQTRKREKVIDAFEKGEVPLFLISLKAGGVGLNLTSADTIIHYDPWWNPAVENQATDRAHRIGQDKPVFVYKLLTEGTVEERISEMQARKQALVGGLLDGNAASATALKPEDLEGLFAPLS